VRWEKISLNCSMVSGRFGDTLLSLLIGIYRCMILSAIALHCSQKEAGNIVGVDNKRRFLSFIPYL
jgi:hypothetical protein